LSSNYSKALIASSANNRPSLPLEEVEGIAILAKGNHKDSKSVAMISISGCEFIDNTGVTIIDTSPNNNVHLKTDQTPVDLMFLGTNSFQENVVSSSVIHTNSDTSLVACLACDMVWNLNQALKLCEVSCNLIGISFICPGSCS